MSNLDPEVQVAVDEVEAALAALEEMGAQHRLLLPFEEEAVRRISAGENRTDSCPVALYLRARTKQQSIWAGNRVVAGLPDGQSIKLSERTQKYIADFDRRHPEIDE